MLLSNQVLFGGMRCQGLQQDGARDEVRLASKSAIERGQAAVTLTARGIGSCNYAVALPSSDFGRIAISLNVFLATS